MEPEWIDAGAEFSENRLYRYTLWRQWAEGDRTVLWVLLNPSTADEVKLDPTLRRFHRFSAAWGFSRMVVLNSFALRSTNPRELYRQPHPVGPLNDAVIAEERAKLLADDLIVVGWGAHGGYRNRDLRVLQLLGSPIMCLDVTMMGYPKHPLYLASDLTLREYTGRLPKND